MSFKSLPILDFKLAENPESKSKFLEDLRYALFSVGFFYLINHGMETEAQNMLDFVPKAFEVPIDEKQKVAMTNSPHFVGYTQLGSETTAKATDLREQYDFGSAVSVDEKAFNNPNQPKWKRIKGPSQYLTDEIVPGFKDRVQGYISGMELVATRLLKYIADSLNLPEECLISFVGDMNRLKLIKYPPATPENFQGVGPHKDSSGLLTFVLQDSVGGLQVLNSEGEWISVTPMKDSLVVNIAQGFEALTGGRCGSTTHRVISPQGSSNRYSIPYFHSVRLDLTLQDIADQLQYIGGKIPDPNDMKRRAVDVGSEFIDPKYSCVSNWRKLKKKKTICQQFKFIHLS